MFGDLVHASNLNALDWDDCDACQFAGMTAVIILHYPLMGHWEETSGRVRQSSSRACHTGPVGG